MLRLVFTNIKSSIKEYNGVYVLLIVTQLLAVIILFMAYGIFCSYSAAKQEFDTKYYEFVATFSGNATVGELRDCTTDIFEQIEPRLNYFYVSATSEEWNIYTYNEYHNGKFYNSKKIYKYMRLESGRLVTEEEINETANVIHGTNVGVVGDKIEIEGVSFAIVGVEVDEELPWETIHMAFTCYPREVCLRSFVLKFKDLPTKDDYKVFKECLINKFGEGVVIQDYEVRNEEKLIALNSIIFLSVLIGVITALDTVLLYGYIMKKRKSQLAVLGICGANMWHKVFFNEMEIMIVTAGTSVIGLIAFRLVLEKVMNYVYNNTVSIFSAKTYMLMWVIYILIVFFATTVATIIISRSDLLDMRKE